MFVTTYIYIDTVSIRICVIPFQADTVVTCVKTCSSLLLSPPTLPRLAALSADDY